MIRFLGMISMGGGFLMISPSLRGTAMQGFSFVVTLIDHSSPYSYVLLGLALLCGLALCFNHTTRPQ